MSRKPTIVLLDDYQSVLKTMEDDIADMPETQDLDVASFTNDEDAARFVSEHRSRRKTCFWGAQDEPDGSERQRWTGVPASNS